MASVLLRLDGRERILLIKPSALGDVVHTLPVVATLRRRYPDARLDWLVEEEAADLVRNHPAVTDLVVSGRRRWLRQLRHPRRAVQTLVEIRRFVAELRSRRYDVVVDLQGLLKSALYVLAAGAPVRIGFAEGREGAPWVLTHRVTAPPQPVHAVDRYLCLAAALDAAEAVRDFTIPLAAGDRSAAAEWLVGCPRPRVVLHAAARWRTKLWEEERWRSLAAALAAEGASVVLTGSPQDAALAARLADGLVPPPRNLVGRLSLKELAAVLGEADVVVTVDSGPMHIAAAMGTPVVALFGPTDPRRTGPLGPGLVLRRELPCSPCLRRRCAIPETYLCMRELGIEQVLAAVRRLLAQRL